MQETKYTMADIEKAVNTYGNRVIKALKITSLKQCKIIGVPKIKWDETINRNIQKYKAGVVEIKFALKGFLENGELPSIEELNKAKERAGFIVPNQAPKNMEAKTFKEVKTEEIEDKKVIGEK